MDLQTRKIVFVQEFLKLESEKAIARLEKVLENESEETTSFQPLSIKEFQNRIDQSVDDSNNGRLTEAKDLLSQIEKWS